MQETTESLKSQLVVLEERLSNTDERLEGGKWNPRYFALKGMIKNIKIKIVKSQSKEGGWQQFLAQ